MNTHLQHDDSDRQDQLIGLGQPPFHGCLSHFPEMLASALGCTCQLFCFCFLLGVSRFLQTSNVSLWLLGCSSHGVIIIISPHFLNFLTKFSWDLKFRKTILILEICWEGFPSWKGSLFLEVIQDIATIQNGDRGVVHAKIPRSSWWIATTATIQWCLWVFLRQRPL